MSAPVLFFVLGAAIAMAKVRLPLPDGFGKALAVYLLVAIGFKGGVAMAGADTASLLPLLLTAAGLSFTLPLLAYALLRGGVRLDPVNAAALATHYGSVSLVTFVAATRMLENQGVTYGGHMVAVLAVMEGPAIVTGLVLAARMSATGHLGIATGAPGGALVVSSGPGSGSAWDRGPGWQPGTLRHALRHAALDGSVLLLSGALLVGLVTGRPGLDRLSGFFVAPWDGVLCLFLLEMGHLAASRMGCAARLGPRLLAFGLGMPLLGAAIGLAAAGVLGLRTGDAALLATLCASASYIAVPAALRHALPAADPGISLPVALGITFPFNLLFGIPLYLALAKALG
ncbi:sodium-dependent bicarbonate transport family permease [Arenibaculum pallidiluteum]|uniref:sodium-dependent bicarbonate transport family permease n=1 Tax=Arenibaculum pallidiluteum TaxID=2812559 RepID=UPI001F406A3F|nr:sodium-dependent bicarbonate transport family permease [Arenibaculum pallidiluteum]